VAEGEAAPVASQRGMGVASESHGERQGTARLGCGGTSERKALLDTAELSEAEKARVKKVADELLSTLKHGKLVLDWRKQQATRAAVRVTVEETLDRLPEAYTRQIYAQKCDAVYQHVFDSYWDDGHSVYELAA
jgi:hypothetical protein